MKKTTKLSLVLSVLMMIFSVSMLVSTTFAWFTDSASTGVNKIQAGNLSLKVEKSDDFLAWSEISSTESVFDENVLWEPGHTEVVYFKVTNEGSLALKYDALVNVYNEVVGTNVAGASFSLSDFIEVGMIKMTETSTKFATRTALLDALTTTSSLQAFDAEEVALLAGKSDYFALVLVMPEAVANEANYRGVAPAISFALTFTAKQLNSETDSFGADYDEHATLGQRVLVKGVKGFENKEFKTMKDAYEAIKPAVEALAGLEQATATNQEFDALFTNGGAITWEVYGEHEITDPYMLSFGRTATYYNPERWLNEFYVVGHDAKITFAKNITLPRNWWTYAADPITLSFNNVQLVEEEENQIIFGQAYAYDINVNLTNCEVLGNIYMYHNNVLNMNIKNTNFVSKNDSYAIMLQGDHPGKFVIDGCHFNEYSRGVNFERGKSDFVLTNCVFESTRAEYDRGVIQLTDGKSFKVNANKIVVNQGNAIWFHSVAKNSNVTYEISNNDISASYLANDDTSFGVNNKITSSGNIFNATDTLNCMEKEGTAPTLSTVTAIK